MNYGTISNVPTIAGNGEGAILAGRYRVVRQLGQGGMGSVWLTEDKQLDNMPFAIKMLPSILVSNKRAYRQLKDEALVAMKLTHPNIVTLRAFEENNGNPFLVMDYIDGQTLDDYLTEKGKLSEDEALRVLCPIAAALDYAHLKGVVHRDVKPGNVMIAKDGTPYILDFGIAREIQETMTRVTGKLSSGTLLYMSPEQLHGESPKPAQDIYSFAAMAYECLKGEPPFVRGQIEFQIDNDEPSPLLGGTCFCASVMAGLAKKSEDRPPTCAALLAGDDFQRRGAESLRVVTNGDGRVEHVESVESASVMRRQNVRPPTGAAALEGKNVRVEHVERVESSSAIRRQKVRPSTDAAELRSEGNSAASALTGQHGDDAEQKKYDGNARKFSRKKVILLAASLGLVMVGGLWWANCSVKEVRPSQSERGVRRKVQLWENGPYWACKNIGAEEPWESGYYFWWGDTVGYKRENDAWVASDGSSSISISLFDPGNTLIFRKDYSTLRCGRWITADDALMPKHDAAHVQWGGEWRMPTSQELDDLCNKCKWIRAKMNGVEGYLVQGKGNYSSARIFLPRASCGFSLGPNMPPNFHAGSYGYYWSSVADTSDYDSWGLRFNSYGHGTDHFNRTCYGFSVRPVQGSTK